MRVKSKPGHGSTFVLSIPLRHVSAQAEGSASSTLPTYSNPTDDYWNNRSSGLALSIRQSQARPNSTSRTESPLGKVADPVAPDVSRELCPVSPKQPHSLSGSASEASVPVTSPLDRTESSMIQRKEATRVLVAEDNATNQVVITQMLKLEGILDVTIAMNGQDAVDKAKESLQSGESYDLVFMDVQMPYLDGIEATMQIRKLDFSGPIVALTAYTEVRLPQTMLLT